MTGPLLFPAPSRAAERTSVFSPLHFPPAFTSLLSCRVSFFPSLHPSPQAAELPEADRGSFTPSGWGVWGGGWGASLPLRTQVTVLLGGVSWWEPGRETWGLFAGSSPELPSVPRGGEHHSV